jgi:RNA polymerase sigma factor (sigma-70 family)
MEQITVPAPVGNIKTLPASNFLSRDEERHLVELWQKHRDLDARNRLVTAFLPLISRVVRDFMRAKDLRGYLEKPKREKSSAERPLNLFSELVGVAVVGLEVRKDRECGGETKQRGFLRAIDRFDLTQDFRLATIAHYWIIDALTQWYLLDCKRGWSRFPDGASFIQHTSLDQALGNAGDDEFTLHDFLADEHEFEIDAEIASAALHQSIVTNLDARQRRIIEARHLHHIDDKPTSLDSLGREFGVSGERMRQIEIAALDKLRHCWRSESSRWSHGEIVGLIKTEIREKKSTRYRRPYRGRCPTNMLFQLGVPRLPKLPSRRLSNKELSALANHKAKLATHSEVARDSLEGWRDKHAVGYSEAI